MEDTNLLPANFNSNRQRRETEVAGMRSVLKNQLPEGSQPPVIENTDLFRALSYFAVFSVHPNKSSCNALGTE